MSSTPRNPGLARQKEARTALRVLGLVLLVGGVVAAVTGFGLILATMAGEEFPSPGTVARNMGLFAGGGFAAVIGLGLANAGFAGLTARYASGELSPVAKDTAAYLSDGQGLLGVGRTVDDEQPAAGGRFCGACGTARGADDRFCTGCGAPAA